MPLRPASLQPAIPTGAPGQPPQTMGQDLLSSLSPGGRQAIAQIDIDQQQRDAQRAEQQRLEDENGAIGTLGLQLARGALSALTAPGALVGAAAETTGSVLGSSSLEKFGRELGEASTGSAALEALAFGGSPSDSIQARIDAADAMRTKIDDQQKAWPALSTVANVAGMASFGLATGAAAGLARAGSTLGARLAIGAAEGAAGGTQGAYEQSAPLRDVLTSGMLGSLLGVAAASSAEAIGAGARALSRRITPETEAAIEALSRGEPGSAQPIAELLEGQAEAHALKSFADRQTEVGKIIGRKTGEAAKQELEQVAHDVLAFEYRTGPRAGQKILQDPKRIMGTRANDELPAALFDASEEMGERVGAMMQEIDGKLGQQGGLDLRQYLRTVRDDVLKPIEERTGGLAGPEAERALRDITRHIAPLGKRLNLTEIVHTPQGAVQRPLKVGSEKWWTALEELPEGQARVGFSDLRSQQQALAKTVYPRPISGVAPPVPRSMLELQKLERSTATFLEDEGAAALRNAGLGDNVYRDTMRQYRSIRVAADASNKRFQAQIGNAALGLRDFGVGMASMASGSALTALPLAIATKYVRENSRAFAAVQLQRLANSLQGDVSRGVQVFGRALRSGVRGVRGAEHLAEPVAREVMARSTGAASELWNKRRTVLERTQMEDPAWLTAQAEKQLPGLPDTLIVPAIASANQRLANLLRDMPKATKDFRGPPFEKLSTNDVRLANAMFEATVDPMSIFEDYKNGTVDYDKIQYAWKQYPGLQQACQAGVIDMLQAQMTDGERGSIPDGVVTQLDYFFGFGGALQPSVFAALSRNMTLAANVRPPAPEGRGGQRPLGPLPTASKTRIQRMMG